MKKKILLFLLLTLVLTPAILSQEIETTQVKEQLSALEGGLDSKTENILEKEIRILDKFRGVIQLIFGLKKDVPINIEGLIVLLAVWIMFFIIIQRILTLAPFLNNGWQNIVGSLIITIIIALTGTMNILMAFFFGIGETFELLESMGPFKILIAIGVAVIIIIITNHLTSWIKKNLLIEKAESTGKNIGTMAKMGKIVSKEI